MSDTTLPPCAYCGCSAADHPEAGIDDCNPPCRNCGDGQPGCPNGYRHPDDR